MKKVYIILSIIILLIIAVYLFVRFSVLKTNTVKPDTSKKESVVDLRPRIIAKLQELVKTGSQGLYNLSIDSIEPHVVQSKLDIYRVSLSPDTAALQKLDGLLLAPDDVYKLSFTSLNIEGIGINDLLNKDRIDLRSIKITNPLIQVYHTKRSYNKEKRNDTATLYQRLTKKVKSISVDKIIVANGTYINHNLSKKNAVTKFNDVSINITDLLIDSSTQYDNTRFLFSKTFLMSAENYLFPTPDSLYFFTIKNLSISGDKKSITALDVQLKPRGNKQQFQSKLKYKKDMYDISIPKITMNKIDWYGLMNHENLVAEDVHIFNGKANVYVDRSKPLSPQFNMQNFPHQLLMKLQFPISINKFYLNNLDLIYGEFNPTVDKAGSIYLDNINGSISNLTNVAAEIKKQRYITINSSALFMHKVPMTLNFKFDMALVKSGKFSVDLVMGKFDTSVINSFAGSLGEFEIKNGILNKGTAHIEGNNTKASGTALLLYNDLKITALKKDESKPGGLTKKTITSFLANTLFVKNNNPANGKEPRKAVINYERKRKSGFFNFIWKAILHGIFQIIGLPEKLADK